MRLEIPFFRSLLHQKFWTTKHLEIFFFFQKMLDEATEPWGIKVERVEMWGKKHFHHSIIFIMSITSITSINYIVLILLHITNQYYSMLFSSWASYQQRLLRHPSPSLILDCDDYRLPNICQSLSHNCHLKADPLGPNVSILMVISYNHCKASNF